MNKDDLAVTRDYLPSDKNFVLATWLRGIFYGDTWFKEIPKNIFMENYHKVLERILEHPSTTVKVSCLIDDPDVILGYAVLSKNGPLHWVFCKKAWRGIGIAKSLVPSTVTTVTHLTKVGLSIIRKNPNVIFNPFAI